MSSLGTQLLKLYIKKKLKYTINILRLTNTIKGLYNNTNILNSYSLVKENKEDKEDKKNKSKSRIKSKSNTSLKELLIKNKYT